MKSTKKTKTKTKPKTKKQKIIKDNLPIKSFDYTFNNKIIKSI